MENEKQSILNDNKSLTDIVVNLIASGLGKGEFIVVTDFYEDSLDRFAKDVILHRRHSFGSQPLPFLVLLTQKNLLEKKTYWISTLKRLIHESGYGVVTDFEQCIGDISAFRMEGEIDYDHIMEGMSPHLVDYSEKQINQYLHDLKTWIVGNRLSAKRYLEKVSEETLSRFVRSYTDVEKWRKGKSELELILKMLDDLRVEVSQYEVLQIVEDHMDTLSEIRFDTHESVCSDTQEKVSKALAIFCALEEISKNGVE